MRSQYPTHQPESPPRNTRARLPNGEKHHGQSCQPAQVIPSFQGASKQSKTVVVIENNAADMSLLTSVLSSNRYRILTADTPKTGMAMIENAAPDLIIVNTDLFDRDGSSLPLGVRSLSTTNYLPIIAVSSHALPEAEEEAFKGGCSAFVAKPIDPAEIIETIDGLLPDTPQEVCLEPSDNFTRARILIVDDEVMNLKLFKAYLATENYELVTAASGPEALMRADQTPPDVILLDIMMPGMDGFEVTRRLKENPDTAGIPIIMVTALSGEKNRARGLEAGADEFVTKPVHRAELVARVGSMLRLKRVQDQLRSRQASQGQLNAGNENPFSEAELIPTILVVEDDDLDARLLRTYLEEEPYIVRRVQSGETAIGEELDHPSDLMILDIMLPGIDGFEVCRRVKSDHRLKNTQVLLLTSLHELEYRIQGTKLGADDYLVKPVDPRELQVRVQALLKKKQYIDKLNHRYESALNRAIRDGLTGLFNHDYFKRFFEFEIKRSQRQRHPLALLLIDLDNFKQVNDQFGHQAGDRLLIKAGKHIRDSLRDVDFVARYGGEEFVVILPYVSHQNARDIAERIRMGFAQATVKDDQGQATQPVSASIGVAYCPEDGMDVEVLIRKADEMMYLAKQLGKNQTCFTSDY